MKTTQWLNCWQLGLLGLLTSAGINAFTCRTLAQTTPSNIKPDSTLGAEASQILQNFQGLPIEVIRGGATRGINLFHSFLEFNVSAGRGAYFFSPSADIQNIFARVTGANRSEILGTLGTFGNSQPNLYLINPNGIIFGKNASLDVQGSFVGTTANGVQFGKQGNFSATNPQPVPLLTINPSALFVNQLNKSGGILNQSQAPVGVNLAGEDITGLRVPDGKSLLLVGGNVNLDGGGLTASGGRVELAGLSAPGNVGLNVAGDILSLSVPNDVQRGNISLSNRAFVDVTGAGKGDIAINASNLQMYNSSLLAGIGNGLGNGNTKAGDININADAISLTNGAQINNATNGQGDTGNIIVNVRDGLNISDIGSQIFSGTRIGAVGHSGNINIQAGKVVVENNGNDEGIGAISYGKGDTGDVTINTRNLIVRNSQVGTDVYGVGNAGNVKVIASESVELSGEIPGGNEPGFPGGIFAQVDVTGKGTAGNLYIETGRLSVSDGSKVQVATFGEGNAGSLLIRANEIDVFDTGKPHTFYTGIFATVGIDPRTVTLPKGNAGDVTIETGKLSLRNGGSVAVYTQGEGNGGRLIIKASDSVEVTGNSPDIRSEISAEVTDSGIGNGGSITIETPQLSVTNGGQITSSTSGKGNAGTIDIQAGNIFVKDGGLIISSTFGKGDSGNISITANNAISLDGASYIANSVQSVDAVGNGGNIDIKTGSLTATNGAEINSFTRGQGNAGNITIQAKDGVTFDGQDSYGNLSGSFSSVESGAVGNGGNINITAGSLSLTNGGTLRTNVREQSGTVAGGKGIGGNVNINVRDALTIAGVDSGIFGSLNTGAIGRGGDIKVEAGNLFVRDGGVIISNTLGKGDAGNISITASDAIFLDGASYIANSVQSRNALGNAGKIDITTGSLSVTNGAQINSFTRGQGNAGNVTVIAKDAVSLANAGILSTVEAGGVGKGGDIDINAATLSLTDGAQLLTLTRGASATQPAGRGDAGNVNVKVTGAVDIAGEKKRKSGIASFVDTGTVGNAGNITIDSGSFSLRDAEIVASTLGQGKAGNIRINAKDAVTVSGTSQETGFPTGLFVSSTGSGITGDIEINAPKVTLDNQGKLNAESASGNGGNINVNSDLLLLRHNSQISTNAGTEQKGGNGGNININSRFIVAIPNENSDISANAFTGAGGNIQINSQGIFGIEARPKPTENSDITASSELGVSGVININVPDTSSIQNSFAERFPNAIDTNALISQSCIARGDKRQENSFFITGSGALNPNQPGVMVSLYSTGEVRGVEPTSRPWKKGDPIIEPTGVYRLSNGQILLSRECSN